MEFFKLTDCFRYREKRLPEELLLLENMTLNIFSKWNNDYCNVFFPENIVPFLKKYVELKNKKQLTSEETNDVGIVDSYMIVSKRFWKDNINTRRSYKTPVIRFLTLNYSISFALNREKTEIESMFELENTDLTDNMKEEVICYREKIRDLLGTRL